MFFFRPNRYYNQQNWPPHPMHYPPFHQYDPYSMPPPNQQGFFKNLNIESILNKIQKILGIAEQVTPLIEQYGPLIKSAPALLQLLKETSEDEDDVNESDSDQSSGEEANEDDDESSGPQKKKKRRSDTIKESVPKLYI